MIQLAKCLSLILLVVGCGGGSPDSLNAEVQELPLDSSKPQNTQYDNRKLIKKGDVSWETTDMIKSRKYVEQAIHQHNGYVSSENTSKSDYRESVNIEVRVPSDEFDAFVTSLEKNVGQFETKNISVNDVTAEYVDVQARIKGKKALEVRYFALLKKAKDIEETLKIEKELSNLRGEIESMQGRFNLLKNQVTLSTLTVSFYKLNTFQRQGFFAKLWQSLKDGWGNLESFILLISVLWPFLILIPFVVWFYKKRIKQKK